MLCLNIAIGSLNTYKILRYVQLLSKCGWETLAKVSSISKKSKNPTETRIGQRPATHLHRFFLQHALKKTHTKKTFPQKINIVGACPTPTSEFGSDFLLFLP